MSILRLLAMGVVLGLWCPSTGMAADRGLAAIERTIVYIECKSGDGTRMVRGTGVLVKTDGTVLTAKHVVPSGFNCLGLVGTAGATPNRRMILDSRVVSVDAVLLRFIPGPGEVFPAMSIQRLQASLSNREVIAYGFPNGGVGAIDSAVGTISQTIIDSRGIFGTTALTSSGMSGGPVLLKETGNLLGIIVGADFDSTTGAPRSFGVLAAQEVAVAFELQAVPLIGVKPVDFGTAYEAQFESLLREVLAANAAGKCPEIMGALLRAQCQLQITTIGPALVQKGALLSTVYVGLQPTPMGNAEVYQVNFSRGQMVWMLNTTPDGKLLVLWAS